MFSVSLTYSASKFNFPEEMKIDTMTLQSLEVFALMKFFSLSSSQRVSEFS